MGFGSGPFGVWGLGFRVWGSGFRVQGLGFGVSGLGLRVYMDLTTLQEGSCAGRC